MKKIAVLLLILTLVFSTSVSAFASYNVNYNEVKSLKLNDYLVNDSLDEPGTATDAVVHIYTEGGKKLGKYVLIDGIGWVLKSSVTTFGAAATSAMGGLLVIAGLSLSGLIVSNDQASFLYAYNLNGSIIDRFGNEITPNDEPFLER